MESVRLTRLIEKMKLENLTPEIDVKDIRITQPDVNRPALPLAGYFEHFDSTRLQIIGFVEYSYMENMPDERKREIYDEFMSYDVSAVVFCRELKPDPIFVQAAVTHQVPLLSTKKSTSAFMAEAIRWLNVKLAPCISVHGVLVDVYGEGLLITVVHIVHESRSRKLIVLHFTDVEPIDDLAVYQSFRLPTGIAVDQLVTHVPAVVRQLVKHNLQTVSVARCYHGNRQLVAVHTQL